MFKHAICAFERFYKNVKFTFDQSDVNTLPFDPETVSLYPFFCMKLVLSLFNICSARWADIERPFPRVRRLIVSFLRYYFFNFPPTNCGLNRAFVLLLLNNS